MLKRSALFGLVVAASLSLAGNSRAAAVHIIVEEVLPSKWVMSAIGDVGLPSVLLSVIWVVGGVDPGTDTTAVFPGGGFLASLPAPGPASVPGAVASPAAFDATGGGFPVPDPAAYFDTTAAPGGSGLGPLGVRLDLANFTSSTVAGLHLEFLGLNNGSVFCNPCSPTSDYTSEIRPLAPLPEPSTLVLMGLGFAGLAFIRRRGVSQI